MHLLQEEILIIPLPQYSEQRYYYEAMMNELDGQLKIALAPLKGYGNFGVKTDRDRIVRDLISRSYTCCRANVVSSFRSIGVIHIIFLCACGRRSFKSISSNTVSMEKNHS